MSRLEELKKIAVDNTTLSSEQNEKIGTELLSLAEKACDTEGVILAYSSLSMSSLYSLDKSSMLKYAGKLLDIATEAKKWDYVGQANELFATYYSSCKQDAFSLRYHFTAVKAYEKIDDYYALSCCYQNISGVFLASREFDKAEYYMQLSKEYLDKETERGTCKKEKLEFQNFATILNYSFLLVKQKKYDELLASLDFLTSRKDMNYYLIYQIFIYILYARYYAQIENNKEFVKNVNSVLAINSENINEYEIFNDLCVFFDRAIVIQDYELAERINDRMVKIAETEDYPSLLVSTYKRRIALYKVIEKNYELLLIKRKYFQALKSESTYMDTEKSEFVDASLHAIKLSNQNEKNLKYIENFEQKSLYDALTGVGSRYALDKNEKLMFLDAIEEEKYYSVVIIDIDYFKEFNDNYGHLEGDLCLQKTAETIDNCSEGFFCGRYGGDEFLLVAKGKSPEETLATCELIRKEISLVNVTENIAAPITLSMGFYSALPKEGDTHFDFIDRADEYLYKVKENGRNNVCGNS